MQLTIATVDQMLAANAELNKLCEDHQILQVELIPTFFAHLFLSGQEYWMCTHVDGHAPHTIPTFLSLASKSMTCRDCAGLNTAIVPGDACDVCLEKTTHWFDVNVVWGGVLVVGSLCPKCWFTYSA